MTLDLFRLIFPRLTYAMSERYWAAIERARTEFEITNLEREAAFVAQGSHETMGLQFLEELGDHARFTRLYEGREDLGNTQPGDGVKYHGRGLFQLTGRANYREYGQALGLPLEADPDQAATVETGSLIAGLFWKRHGCNELADIGLYESITRKINGGLTGYPDRFRRWILVRKVLGI